MYRARVIEYFVLLVEEASGYCLPICRLSNLKFQSPGLRASGFFLVSWVLKNMRADYIIIGWGC